MITKSRDTDGTRFAVTWRSVLLVLGSIYISTTCLSLARASGVLFAAMMARFQVATATTGWVFSIFAGLLLGAGALSGSLCANLGAAVTCVLGTLILSVGMLTSAFVDSIYVMYVTFGVIGGIGSSLTFVSVQVLIQQNFDKRRALAASLASLGIGAGSLLLPQIHTLLLVSAGLSATLYLVSGMCFSACLVSVLFIPLTRKSTEVDTGHSVESQTEKAARNENEKSDDDVTDSARTCCSGYSARACCSGYTFMSGPYISILVSVFLGAFAVFVPMNLLPALLAEKDMPPDQISRILACAGPGDIVGKIVIGLLADFRRVDRSIYEPVCLLVLGSATLAAIFLQHEYQFICYTVLFGMASGVWTCLQPVITMDIVGPGFMARAFGLVCMVQGAAATVGLPAAGWLVDMTSSFNASLIASGVGFLLAAIVAVYIPAHKAGTRRNSPEVDVNC